MASEDYARIRLGDHEVGLMGVAQAFKEMAQSHASLSDEEGGLVLVRKLQQRNYIPRSAEAEYGRALMKEFSRFTGQPTKEDSGEGLLIKVLGPGCAQCNRLEQAVMQVLSQENLPASVEHVTDAQEIARHGFVMTPALVINGEVVIMGKVPTPGKIRELLKKAR
jgi:small redox-active disulfide protein 2